ncbi:MAG: LLM class flavin-dependent oxidoreductase [Pseudobdellovibrio sp.]
MSSPFFINALPPNDRRIDSDYLRGLSEIFDKSCELGFEHTLITIGDKRHDPWVLAQYALNKNCHFKPLIATNPIHQHPVALAKKIISLNSVAQTNVALNLVSGSFMSEMTSIGNNLSFQQRNDRLVEFLQIIRDLVSDPSTYSYSGQYYQVENVDLYPKSTGPNCKFFISGQFETQASLINDDSVYFVKNYRPLDLLPKSVSARSGLNVGLCVRPTESEALAAVKELYPSDRQGELLYSLAVENNETPWNIWIKDYLKNNRDDDPLFYLKPFKTYQSNSPFIVASYEKAAEHLKKYVEGDYNFFVLDFHRNDYEHIKILMDLMK